MSYYDPEHDILYEEAEIGKYIVGLVDLIYHSAWVINNGSRNPFEIDNVEIRLRNPKSYYTFFKEQWADKQEIKCILNSEKKGLKISDVHVTALLYALRQNFFIDIDPDEKNSIVGWYLDPKEVFLNCLPDLFEDFQSIYSQFEALGLQGRRSDILGYLSNTIGNYVRNNHKQTSIPFKTITVQ